MNKLNNRLKRIIMDLEAIDTLNQLHLWEYID